MSNIITATQTAQILKRSTLISGSYGAKGVVMLSFTVFATDKVPVYYCTAIGVK